MNRDRHIFVCPDTRETLVFEPDAAPDSLSQCGLLCSASGKTYPVRDGIPILVPTVELSGIEQETLDYYEGVAGIYDDVAHLSFAIQCVDEAEKRREFVELLRLKPDARVLEIACGTGRDSVNIASMLGSEGELYLQDISEAMLKRCREKLKGAHVPIEYCVGTASSLPYPDDYFDAVFSFGGLSVFGDIKHSLAEMVRVSKSGARVVVGDESMAPWLYDTEYGRILLNNNPLFKAELPLRDLPPEARDVRIKWVVGGVYYLIDFNVGEGEPPANFDMPIPGARGGTLRTRYFGKLEGVTPETLRLAQEARQKSGKSMHQWLEDVIRKAALNGPNES